MPIKPNYTPTILIVDDEPFNLEFLEIVLKQQGYNIISANNGRDGRNIAEQRQPDLILLDIMMPEENGFECATVLRLTPETAEIPIIFLTALDDARNTAKGFDAGAMDFIVKPFDYNDVIHRIRLHMKISAYSCIIHGSSATSPAPFFKIPEETEASPKEGTRATFTMSPPPSETYFYETVILSEAQEGHLLLNFTSPIEDLGMPTRIRQLLAANTGPLFTPAETLRNIGIALKNEFNNPEILGIYAHIDRNIDKMTVVNAGANPAVFINRQSFSHLIERHSGPLGSLGCGMLPCATLTIKKGDRLFLFSKGLLSLFKSEGEGIKELKEACEMASGVDIETACQACGEMLQKNGYEPEGILIGIEG